MDKSWITMPRNSVEYEQGLRRFIEFAFENRCVNDKTICPCPRCGFNKWQSRDVVYEHLICRQFPEGYTFWFYHGETREERSNVHSADILDVVEDEMVNNDPIRNMINDAFGIDRPRTNEPFLSNDDIGEDIGLVPDATQTSDEVREFYELVRDGEQQLYEGCTKYSKLSFLVKLYHIKCLCGISDKAITMILELLQDAFQHAKIPSSFYEAKKIITKLGLNYEKIHACPNNCMLYWGNNDDAERQKCKVCNQSRWKSRTKEGGEETCGDNSGGKKKVPAKVLRYFPLKSRLQRLFLCSKTAEDMRWHAVDSNKDGMMRHPRDSEAWKAFDTTHSWFASDPRNVRR